MKAIARRRIQREIIKRQALICHEKRNSFQFFVALSSKSEANRYRLDFDIFKQKAKARRSHCRHHCFISGRAHSIYKAFRLTRNMVRELAHRGYIYGLRKASW